MHRFHEAPAAAVAASKTPDRLDGHRITTVAYCAFGPIPARGIQ